MAGLCLILRDAGQGRGRGRGVEGCKLCHVLVACISNKICASLCLSFLFFFAKEVSKIYDLISEILGCDWTRITFQIYKSDLHSFQSRSQLHWGFTDCWFFVIWIYFQFNLSFKIQVPTPSGLYRPHLKHGQHRVGISVLPLARSSWSSAAAASSISSFASSSSWHTPKIATEDIAIAKSSVAKSSGYHHHRQVGSYDYNKCWWIWWYDYDFDDTVDDHENPGVTLVSEDGDLIWPIWAARRRSYQI